MTSTEPMTNKPGPELDKLLASQLFGFEVHESLPIMFEKPNSDFKTIPAYSTSWEGMRMVVERLAEEELFAEIRFFKSSGRSMLDSVHCFLRSKYGGIIETVFHAESAPYAVALSALQHVSNTEE